MTTTYLVVAPGGSGHTAEQADESRPAGVASITTNVNRYGAPILVWAFENYRVMDTYWASESARADLRHRGILASGASDFVTVAGIVKDWQA